MNCVRLIITLAVLFVNVNGNDHAQKRILLSDSDYLQHELDRIQSQIYDLLGKVSSQKFTLDAYETSLMAHQTVIDSQGTLISQLQSEIDSRYVTPVIHSLIDVQKTVEAQRPVINAMRLDTIQIQTTLQARRPIFSELRTNNTLIQSQIDDIKTKAATTRSVGSGVYFVRWGRMDCPRNYSLIYSGYAGGSHFQHKGAAVDYVCLPKEPIWGPNKDKAEIYPGYMYGAEYENPDVFQMKDNKQDVPCAVCLSSSHAMMVMIPARTSCYNDWSVAYNGTLASGNHQDPAASQYVCVDQQPQALPGGQSDDNGKLFHAVQSKCNPLPCPKYEDGSILACVVCVK